MFDKIKNLPLPFKIVGTSLTLGAVVVGGRMMSLRAILILVLGLIVAALLVGLWMLYQRHVRNRQAANMGGQLARHSTVAPRGVSDPAQRAKLDNLRQTFQKGLDKFRAAGKDLYSLPWYMVVGEPGSGKTEAIRHCNVGFPPGLQDELQGAGGTINMNWWFTNYSVFLDTAGRLMFEEVAPGSTNEWREFLNLLKTRRPSCPINGLILVIPADSLIRDTADEIGRKASRIAQQFSTIQGALDVRFPVFVLITKTDLINGFREFFEHVKDPNLQHQMLGWSNPDPLDQAFRPELVDKHLDQVVHRVRRRRLGLMQDPTPLDDPTNGRRLDDVDALFALPASVGLIAPRLRRYLEMVFMPNEWSGKPLFLRGIYFTSAMREGSALDQELAEAIGVSVDSLPEGKTWERERAYFLRDLFIEKVFREKGLVTRASNTRTLLRRRQAIVWSSVGLLAMMLAVIAWVGRSAVRESVGRELEYWQVAGAGWQENAWRPIVAPPFKNSPDLSFYGEQEVMVGGERFDLAGFHRRLAELVEKDIEVPWVFRPMSGLVTGTNAERRAAQRRVFEASVIRPMVEAARDRMQRLGDNWTPAASETLALLVRIECMIQYRSRQVSTEQLSATRFFQPLNNLLFGDRALDTALVRAFESTYLRDREGRENWPPDWLSAGSSLHQNPALDVGVQAFLKQTRKTLEAQEEGYQMIRDVLARLREMRTLETALYRAATQPGGGDADIKKAADAFLGQKRQLDLALTRATASGLFAPGSMQMFVSYQALGDETRKQTEAATGLLQGEIDRFAGPDAGDDGFPLATEIRAGLQAVLNQVKAKAASTFTNEELTEMQQLDRLFLERTPAGEAIGLVRSDLYGRATSQIDEPGGPTASLVGAFPDSIKTLNSTIALARDQAAHYQGAFAIELTTVMKRLLDFAETRGLEALYDRYSREVDDTLRGKVGFPLVRDSSRAMSVEDLREVTRKMRLARGDLPELRAGKPPGRSVAALDALENRVRWISAVADGLLNDDGAATTVTVALVNSRDQRQGLKQRFPTEEFPARSISYVWRAVSVNGGVRAKTDEATNTELAKVNVAAPTVSVDLFLYTDHEAVDRTFSPSGDWAVLQLLHSSAPRRLASGKEWEIAITQKDANGQDRSLLVQLQFEKPLPELEQWPTSTRLGL